MLTVMPYLSFFILRQMNYEPIIFIYSLLNTNIHSKEEETCIRNYVKQDAHYHLIKSISMSRRQVIKSEKNDNYV